MYLYHSIERNIENEMHLKLRRMNSVLLIQDERDGSEKTPSALQKYLNADELVGPSKISKIVSHLFRSDKMT